MLNVHQNHTASWIPGEVIMGDMYAVRANRRLAVSLTGVPGRPQGDENGEGWRNCEALDTKVKGQSFAGLDDYTECSELS